MRTWLLYLAKRNKAHEACPLGRCGGIPPGKYFDFRSSEIVSGAFLG